jgi:hypothetical protein
LKKEGLILNKRINNLEQKSVEINNDSNQAIINKRLKAKKLRSYRKFFYKNNDGWIEPLDIRTVHDRSWDDTIKAKKVKQKDWTVQGHLPSLRHGYLAWGGHRSYEPENLMHMKLADPHFDVYFQFYSEQDGKVKVGKSKL